MEHVCLHGEITDPLIVCFLVTPNQYRCQGLLMCRGLADCRNIGVLEGKTPAMVSACLFSLRMQVSLTYPLLGDSNAYL